MEHNLTGMPQIIATIGPTSAERSVLTRMIDEGLSAARFNFTWGTDDERRAQICLIDELASLADRRIILIQDLSGPREDRADHHAFNPALHTAVTATDLTNLDFGAERPFDYVALSYVGGPDDVHALREALTQRGLSSKIIAKIERQSALQHLDAIIAAADAVMVARGDLGTEVPLERIPYVQQDIINAAHAAQKPVITATQMLFSMTHSNEPTRAEIADVTQAIAEGTDAVMLSDETTTGIYPAEAVAVMRRIIEEAHHQGTLTPRNLL